MKKTPFHEINLNEGAQMRELFGYYLPWEYAPGAVEEHIGTRQRVSLCDLDYMGEFTIEGPDSLNFIQKILTTDCSKQKIGQVKYTTLCDENGNMVDDGTIWRHGDRNFVLITGDEADFEWLQNQAEGYDVSIENVTSERTTLALQGPKSRAVLKKLTNLNVDTLSYYHFVKGEINGVECIIARMGYTGESGFEFHFSPKYAQQMWGNIMKAGAEFNIVPCGQCALESLRQEAGYLLVGNDHDKNTNPFEAGLGFTVKFEKDYFNGKQALLDIVTNGINRKLVWFDLKGGQVADKGDIISINGKNVGLITSGSYSPTRKSGTAIGYVDPQFAIPGSAFTIEIEGTKYKAILSTMPLYDPGDWRTKDVAYLSDVHVMAR